MMYRKHVSEPWFSHIKAGHKLIEGRIYKTDFTKMKPGDTVVWWNDQKITTVITNCLPGLTTLEEAVAVYLGDQDQPGYFTVEQEREFGVVAIHFKRV